MKVVLRSLSDIFLTRLRIVWSVFFMLLVVDILK